MGDGGAFDGGSGSVSPSASASASASACAAPAAAAATSATALSVAASAARASASEDAAASSSPCTTADRSTDASKVATWMGGAEAKLIDVGPTRTVPSSSTVSTSDGTPHVAWYSSVYMRDSTSGITFRTPG